MNGPMRFAIVVAVFAVGTVMVGWWTVPAGAFVFGVLTARSEGAVAQAAVGAGLAWAGLLILTATQGPVASLAQKAAGAMGLPGFVLFAATVLFPVVLAALGAATGRMALKRLVRTDRESRGAAAG